MVSQTKNFSFSVYAIFMRKHRFITMRRLLLCAILTHTARFLTFARRVKKGERAESKSDLALSLSCLGRIRTLTGGTRIRRATITPQGKVGVISF